MRATSGSSLGEKRLEGGSGRTYILTMTATAERVLEEIRRLPPAALREVCEAVNQLAVRIPPVGAGCAAAQPPNATEQAEHELDEAQEAANEASFFAALEEARRLWGPPGRNVPNFD
jgi:hypothetical protein